MESAQLLESFAYDHYDHHPAIVAETSEAEAIALQPDHPLSVYETLVLKYSEASRSTLTPKKKAGNEDSLL